MSGKRRAGSWILVAASLLGSNAATVASAGSPDAPVDQDTRDWHAQDLGSQCDDGSSPDASCEEGVADRNITANWPTPDSKTEIVWSTLPDKVYNYGDIFSGFHVNATDRRVASGRAGLRFRVDPSEDVSSYKHWVQVRAEIREQPMRAPRMGTTQIYDLRFDIDKMPTLTGPITIFQRFNSSIERPDLEVEMAGPDQFPNVDPNTVVVFAFRGEWVHPNIPFLQTNRLVVAIENAEAGQYKVILNGNTIVDETADTRSAAKYIGPQFGIYNISDNKKPMQVTHHYYGLWEYDSKPDFDLIE